ncbi:putative CDP-alcohol phosphatidyltransferase class-I family protein C22A12,10 [Talaromyces islandicus]|uniref:Putative CDP-alcohol phosphatidyltransferase class-I family protein C22A12,10 n=1 Tax=Talaromyces islandicus TaxID=28573 RepID=A0A0U1MB22_TALIS|nr:putative CDP-alcohol phosphatidyltransferase class-I family protein C22A12,10 [Talaromyces islandicus]
MPRLFKMVQEAQNSLSDENLLPLKSYKYSSVDKSYISRYILKHYWNAAVEFLPLWMAPNMVTLLGFLFIIMNVAFVTIYVPDLVGPGPTWVYYSFAFGVWMYSTLDNIDGKQARRTGTSSGLGELFDHGIDSLNCTLASLLETAAMGLGATQLGAFTALIPCLPMFFSTWETFHTHTLYLGYFNGPTEGLLIAIGIMIASGIYGPQIWRSQVSDVFGHPEIFGTRSFLDFWVAIVLGSFLVAHLPACVYNVAQARKRQGLPVLPIFLEWTPILVFTSAVLGWLFSPYSSLLANNHLVLFSIVMSFVFGRMTTKIILAHLLKQPFPYWTMMLVPLIGGALLVNLPLVGLPAITATFELWYLRFYLVYAFTVYMHWAFLVINRITTFLGINCLTIKENKSTARDTVYRNFGEPKPTGFKNH